MKIRVNLLKSSYLQEYTKADVEYGRVPSDDFIVRIALKAKSGPSKQLTIPFLLLWRPWASTEADNSDLGLNIVQLPEHESFASSSFIESKLEEDLTIGQLMDFFAGLIPLLAEISDMLNTDEGILEKLNDLDLRGTGTLRTELEPSWNAEAIAKLFGKIDRC